MEENIIIIGWVILILVICMLVKHIAIFIATYMVTKVNELEEPEDCDDPCHNMHIGSYGYCTTCWSSKPKEDVRDSL